MYAELTGVCACDGEGKVLVMLARMLSCIWRQWWDMPFLQDNASYDQQGPGDLSCICLHLAGSVGFDVSHSFALLVLIELMCMHGTRQLENTTYICSVTQRF